MIFELPELCLIIFSYVSEDDPSLLVPLMFVQKSWKDLIYQCTDIKYLWLPQFSFVCDNDVQDFLLKESNQLTTQDFLSLNNSLSSNRIDASLHEKIINKLNVIDSPIRFCILGKIYHKGLCGLQEDTKKAIFFWEEGATLNDPRCIEELIINLSLENKNFDANLETNFNRIHQLANKCKKLDKSRSAVFNVLGVIYHKRKNYPKALKYLRIASEQGDPYGRTNFANLMFHDLKIDNKLVYYLFKTATLCKNHVLIAFVHFGLYHYNKQNYIEAEKLFEIGYQMGCFDCCNMVGVICNQLEKYEKAFKYFQTADDNGNKEATKNLANCYLQGIGVEPNLTKGFQLLEKFLANQQNE